MANSNKYMREYMQKRRAKRQLELQNLLGAKCCRCNSTDCLEFDHINPQKKSFELSGYHLDQSWIKILIELNKCQLLCKDCHIKKTAEDCFNQQRHGTQWMYRKYKCKCDLCVTNYALERKKYPSRQKINPA